MVNKPIFGTDKSFGEFIKNPPKYTEQEMRNLFSAARERNITGDRHDDKGHPFYKYRSFEEYLKLLK